MSTADFLVELGTEELPPKALKKLSDAFASGLTAGLSAARLEHADVLTYATPRRLAVLVKGLATKQASQTIENRGPPVRIAYDKEGLPTKAAEAFASKCGVSVDALEKLATEKGEWLFYKGTSPGAASTDLLPAIVDKALAGLPIPKRMRWGSGATEFVRPAHWLVMLLGDTVVEGELLGLQAGRLTYGHRFHCPDAITIQSPGDYEAVLRDQGKVIASFSTRRALVVDLARGAAIELGGEAILEPDVVDEVTALVEWPVPVAGRFDASFLRLPDEVLKSTLQDHQRYFPVVKENELLAAFVAISNLQSTQPDEVRRGNERVVLPRLADATFFWDQDTAIRLEDRVAALDGVVYQKGLGSLRDKSARVAQLAGEISGALEADATEVKRAAELARTDLLTLMVGEFPELQGRMGYYYAGNDGEPHNVAVAIEEQYLPRQAGDSLPVSPVGRTLAIADRLDTLAGVFTLGKKPSGNKDPFGLRRQALGLVRILIEGEIDLDLLQLLNTAAELQPQPPAAKKSGKKPATPPSSIATALYDFVIDRLRAWYLDGLAPGFNRGDISAEMFAAVQARTPTSPLDFHQRLTAVHAFTQNSSAESLAAANKRIANILKKLKGHSDQLFDEKLCAEKEERLLQTAVAALLSDHKADLEQRNYESALNRLATLREPVDAYFDNVLVMSDDEQQRNNRVAQLTQVRSLFLDVADISCISTN
jgi:glycyl-tRNA synthetase beta chain